LYISLCFRGDQSLIRAEESIMKVIRTEFEGTPEEYLQVHGALGGTSSNEPRPPNGPEATGAKPEEEEQPVEVTPEFLLQAATRLPLSSNQRDVLRVVSAAKEPGISSEEIAQKVGLTRAQLAGVWGTLGRRLANTPGYPKGGTSIGWKWDPHIHQNRYWALPVLRKVMASGKV
jgi:hypothetical protein